MLNDDVLRIGEITLHSRLIVGTGKYETFELMERALAESGTEMVTVALRRVDFNAKDHLMNHIDLKRYIILPNTAGCYTAEEAIRVARLGREMGIGDLVKLEVLGDPDTLLPDPVGSLEATQVLVKEGFTVMAYTSDDPVAAKRLAEAGATVVMPAGAPIGSGQGILNPNNIRIIIEYLKENDPDYPVIVDAGVGTASDVTVAMELGSDGVLLNTGIAGAADPVRMAHAMRHAVEAGRLAFLAGRIPKKLYATASSPTEGVIAAHRAFHEALVSPAAGVGSAYFPPALRADPFRRWLEDSGWIWGIAFASARLQWHDRMFYVGNASLPRALFEATGEFDERYRHDLFDDWEFGQRLAAAGHATHFVPRAIAWHDHDVALDERLVAARRVGECAAAYEGALAGLPRWTDVGASSIGELEGALRTVVRRAEATGSFADRALVWKTQIALAFARGYESGRRARVDRP